MSRISDQNDQIVSQFSQQAEGYAKLTGAMDSSDRAAAFAGLIGATPEDVGLDLCCGTGALTLDLAPFVGWMTGLDLTPAMLEQARAEQASRGLSNVTWLEGDAYRLPFADGDFSLVTCSAAFHHLAEPHRVLCEMARVCRHGGRVVVRDVTPEPTKSASYDRMERLRDPSHIHALTAQEMAHLGEGLPLATPILHGSITADLPLDAILATSFPEACAISDIRAIFQTDAEEGTDRLGFGARIVDGELRVSYRQTTAIWLRR